MLVIPSNKIVLLTCVLICLSQGSLESKENKPTQVSQASPSKEGALVGMPGHFIAMYRFQDCSEEPMFPQHLRAIHSFLCKFPPLFSHLSILALLVSFFSYSSCPGPNKAAAPTLSHDLCLTSVFIAKFNLSRENLIDLPSPWGCHLWDTHSKVHG